MTSAPAIPNTDELDPRFGALDRLFFVIGAQKAGTTWLQRYLSKHPQVCVPVFKELGYWSVIREGAKGSRMLDRHLARQAARPLPLRILAHLAAPRRMKSFQLVKRMLEGETRGHSSYADALFQQSRGERIAGEINPQYALLSAATFAELAGLARDVRFVYLMRDPLSRTFSGIKHTVRHYHGDDGVTEMRVREAWERALVQRSHSAFAHSRYDQTLQALDAAGQSSKLACFFYETLFQQAEVDRLTQFIGAKSVPAQIDKVSHKGAGKGLAMPADLVARTLDVLAPTYEYMRARFGDRIPASWRNPKQGAGVMPRPETQEA